MWAGDSGSGLSFLRGGRWYLTGVVSAGVPKRLTYSVYTDVVHYIDLLRKFFS